MSGIFGRGGLQRKLVVAANLAAAFELLHRGAPAAAYLFARTLVNARDLLDDDAETPDEKVGRIDDEVGCLRQMRDGGADGGITILALRFIRSLIAARQKDADAMLALSVAFGDIAKHGETYRELEPKDRMPPVDQYSRGILAKQDRVCVADIVHALIAECEQKGQPLSAVEEDTQTILALFDLRDEALSGTLSSRYKAIERAVEAIESC